MSGGRWVGTMVSIKQQKRGTIIHGFESRPDIGKLWVSYYKLSFKLTRPAKGGFFYVQRILMIHTI